ncbi:hypothetical protein Aros01_03973 [Streptosporangium roseum]
MKLALSHKPLRPVAKPDPPGRGRRKAQAQWEMVVKSRPRFFAHWIWVDTVPTVW